MDSGQVRRGRWIRRNLHDDRLADVVSDFGAVLLTERPAAALRVLDAADLMLGGDECRGGLGSKVIRFENGLPALLAMAIIMKVRGVTPKRLRLANRIVVILERAGRSHVPKVHDRRLLTADEILDGWPAPQHPGRNRLVRRILRRHRLLRTRRECRLVAGLTVPELVDLLRGVEGIRSPELSLVFSTRPAGKCDR